MAQNISTPPSERWRIFLGFHNIALYQSQLKKGLEALGCTVTRIAWSDDLQFGQDDSDHAIVFRWLKRAIEWNRNCWKSVDRIPKTHLLQLILAVWRLRVSSLWKKVLQWAALCWTIARHDVIVLSYCGSFLEPSDHTMEPTRRGFLDLRLIKRCGRKLIHTFHGSDSRPPYLDGYVQRNPRKLSPEQIVALTRSRRDLIKGIEKYADYLVTVPAQSYFHSRLVVLHEYLGRPFEMDEPAARANETKEESLVVLHAPSSAHAKGTDELRDAIERLKQKGLEFTYVEIIRRPHAELVAEMSRADIVVDQMFSDRFITGISTEAMYLGKPVILAGYYATYYRRDYEGRFPLPPAIFCVPEQLESELEALLKDPAKRKVLGAAGAAYVREHYSPHIVAHKWIDMIEGRLPREAFFEPRALTYPLGAALSREEARRAVQTVLRVGGREALCLQDKPELEAAIVALAQ